MTEKGFLLTRTSFDQQGRAGMSFWLATEKGSVKLSFTKQQCVFFIKQSQQSLAAGMLQQNSIPHLAKPLGLKTFAQEPVCGIYFQSLKSFYDGRALLNQHNITLFEANFRLEDRFIMERFIRAGVEFVGQSLQKNGYVEYIDPKIKASDFKPQLKMLSIDIECSEKGELYSIGFYANQSTIANNDEVGQGEVGQQESGDDIAVETDNSFKRVLMIGNSNQSLEMVEQPTEAESTAQTLNHNDDLIQWVDNEKQLLMAFEQIIQSYDPDIIIGWNVINFDFRLLVKRAQLYAIKLCLGRDFSAINWRDSRSETNQGFVSINGRVVIDGIAAMKAEAYNFPSFSLEAIAQHFLNQGKATENVAQRLTQIQHDFKFNKAKLAHYNLQDCILVWQIFEKIKLLDFLIFRSQLTGLELDRAGGSVAAFTHLYLPKLHRQGYVSPNLPHDGGLASPGGYVMQSKPGLYKHVIVLDFKSLYPSIIRTFKIDPLGLIEGGLEPENAIQGYRGGLFSRHKHLLPDIITQLWQQRDQAKKQKDAARSQAIKIIMNSFYGVLGSGGCAFYDTKLASSITLRGHEIMQQTALWIEDEGLSVIYGDTDSTFVLLEESLTDEEANAQGEYLQTLINQKWQQKIQQEHQLDCFLEIEFESHFSRFLMPTIRGSEEGSKKRYAGLIKKADSETLIFKGLENVRTDWTELAKDFQQQLYQMVFSGQDPQDFILTTVKQTLAGENDEKLVYRKRLRRALSHYVKNVPPHVKAARLADDENQKRGKPLQYQHKGSIHYLMTLSGPQPLEYLTAKIDYQHYIDKQLEPIADAILPFIDINFSQIVNDQLGLF
jgi:DNA polymerase II